VAVVSLTDKIRFIESVFGTGKLARNSRNFDVRCPICAPKDPTKKKLAILLEDDRCHCWTCGYKAHTLAPLVRKYGNLEKLAEYRERFMPASERNRRCLDITLDEELPKLTLPKDFKLLITASLRDPDVLGLRKYLSSRGLGEREMWYFKLGYSEDPRWKRRVIVPSFDGNGELNYFVGRAIDKTRKPKYDNPDSDKLPIIFNELNIDWTKELLLCEGAFDLMKCQDNAVPLLGSDLNEESALFNAILAHGTPIVLALDDDMKVKKTPKIARKLAEYDIAVRIVRLPSDTDPGKLSRSEMKQLVAEARPFNWRDTFLDKLDLYSRTALAR
jgi:DNA primase